MQENRKKWKPRYFLWEAAVLGLALLGVWGSGFQGRVSRETLLGHLVMAALGVGIVGFLLRQNYLTESLDYDNGEHLLRFWICFLAGLALSFACVYLPVSGWPYLAVFLTLSLFSDSVTGTLASSVLLMLTVLLKQEGSDVFFLYFISGILGVAQFRFLDETFKVWIPFLISLMVLFTCETAGLFFAAQGKPEPDQFVIPAANVVVSSVLLLGILKWFSAKVIFRYRMKYMELLDTQGEQLSAFKQEARKDEPFLESRPAASGRLYYQCMHTAYFCGRIAARLRLNAEALRCAGYYHKIGSILENAESGSVEAYLEAHGFPPQVREILREYLEPAAPLVKKEAAVLALAAEVVSAVMALLAGENGAAPDYDRLIDEVFRKKTAERTPKSLCCSELTQRELTQIKRIFKEEKLYYDFLR
ncbi:MAG: HD domain-containing protein [Clostridium sp.]|nr:HD domain-containing protein [Clostridium sp.]